ncbi:MAG TPA: alpha/beta hydrolase [Stellaceae bacterium]|nr:alpha/beta hydrolase [Stellaceae bacterium]
MTSAELATALAVTGRLSIPYRHKFNPERALSLECYRPVNHKPDAPVVIVQHGQSRNGREYCDAWIPEADKVGALIVAITFPKDAWPDAVTYNNGYVLDEGGAVRPREAWSQAIPGRVFALLREAGVTTRDKTYLWGHSAGGQFVHRLLATQPHGIFEAAGAANSGWYTLPTLDLPYPDGYGGIGVTVDDIKRLLAYPLVLFAGDRDIDGTTENFPKHESAMAQGPHRFARAHFFLERAHEEAARLGITCNWQIVVVPGIAHEGMRMAAFAARYWFA